MSEFNFGPLEGEELTRILAIQSQHSYRTFILEHSLKTSFSTLKILSSYFYLKTFSSFKNSCLSLGRIEKFEGVQVWFHLCKKQPNFKLGQNLMTLILLKLKTQRLNPNQIKTQVLNIIFAFLELLNLVTTKMYIDSSYIM